MSTTAPALARSSSITSSTSSGTASSDGANTLMTLSMLSSANTSPGTTAQALSPGQGAPRYDFSSGIDGLPRDSEQPTDVLKRAHVHRQRQVADDHFARLPAATTYRHVRVASGEPPSASSWLTQHDGLPSPRKLPAPRVVRPRTAQHRAPIPFFARASGGAGAHRKSFSSGAEELAAQRAELGHARAATEGPQPRMVEAQQQQLHRVVICRDAPEPMSYAQMDARKLADELEHRRRPRPGLASIERWNRETGRHEDARRAAIDLLTAVQASSAQQLQCEGRWRTPYPTRGNTADCDLASSSDDELEPGTAL